MQNDYFDYKKMSVHSSNYLVLFVTIINDNKIGIFSQRKRSKYGFYKMMI